MKRSYEQSKINLKKCVEDQLNNNNEKTVSMLPWLILGGIGSI